MFWRRGFLRRHILALACFVQVCRGPAALCGRLRNILPVDPNILSASRFLHLFSLHGILSLIRIALRQGFSQGIRQGIDRGLIAAGQAIRCCGLQVQCRIKLLRRLVRLRLVYRQLVYTAYLYIIKIKYAAGSFLIRLPGIFRHIVLFL